RVAVFRRNIEPAYGLRTRPARFGRGIRGEALAGACPAGDAPRIERVDVGLQRADEVVIARGIVVFDHRYRDRRNVDARAGEVGRDVLTGHAGAADGVDAVGR